MKSPMRGDAISAVEVTNISNNGLWLLAGRTEMFLSFDEFPWFKDASVSQIIHVEEPRAGHYYWPDLDIDLSAEIIQNPDRYPLKYK